MNYWNQDKTAHSRKEKTTGWKILIFEYFMFINIKPNGACYNNLQYFFRINETVGVMKSSSVLNN